MRFFHKPHSVEFHTIWVRSYHWELLEFGTRKLSRNCLYLVFLSPRSSRSIGLAGTNHCAVRDIIPHDSKRIDHGDILRPINYASQAKQHDLFSLVMLVWWFLEYSPVLIKVQVCKELFELSNKEIFPIRTNSCKWKRKKGIWITYCYAKTFLGGLLTQMFPQRLFLFPYESKFCPPRVFSDAL